MFIRLKEIALLVCLAVMAATPTLGAGIDEWNALILDGSKQKIEGNYPNAIQSFSKALALAEKEKMPDKCLPISLCRLAEVELLNNDSKQGDKYFDRITKLIELQKNAHNLDPQVNFWASALADAYQGNHTKETRELCLKHACYLKALVYGLSHGESTECLSKLADCYVEENKIDEAIKALAYRDALLATQLGKDPDRYGDTLNNIAIHCEKEHKYDQANQLELEVIKLAEKSKSALNAGLPAFYCFSGMNLLAQGASSKSKERYRKAILLSKPLTGIKNQWACKYLNLLAPLIWADRLNGKFAVAEEEFTEVINVHKKLGTDNCEQYDLISKLADVWYADYANNNKEKLLQNAMECLNTAIGIAKTSRDKLGYTIPDLYMRLGVYQFKEHNIKDAVHSFDEAIKNETDKKGYHAALVFLNAGVEAGRLGLNRFREDQLSKAYSIVKALPSEKRGTILADLIQMRAAAAQSRNDQEQASKLFRESAAEITLQKTIRSRLGPDLFYRM